MSKLFPTAYVESTYTIDYQAMYDAGYRGIIFDIDNTLVPHDAPHTEESLGLIKRLKDMGYSCAVVSNNDRDRVEPFASEAGLYFVHKAQKPAGKGYRAAAKDMGLDYKTTFCVGDQIFTDVWGANRAGLFNFLVKPLDKDFEIQIILKRILEKLILKLYLIKHSPGFDYSSMRRVEGE